MEQTLHNLKYGADCHVDESRLPGMIAGNGSGMFVPRIGARYTDELVTMIKKGFVCGPYDEPPMEDIRCNPLFVIEQRDKWRTILNMSYPEGQSFNDAIETAKLRKLTMASPRQIANLIRSLGQGAIMSKEMIHILKLCRVLSSKSYDFVVKTKIKDLVKLRNSEQISYNNSSLSFQKRRSKNGNFKGPVV